MLKKSVINASELHRSAGKALKRVALNDEHLVVERDGYPVAVLVSYPEYESLMRDRAISMHRKLTRSLGQEAERQDFTEEKLLEEIASARPAVFEDMYGEPQL